MCGQTFLGVANYNGMTVWDATQSLLFTGTLDKQFIQYQEISTQGARDMTSFEYNGHTYLAIANSQNNDGNTTSTARCINGSKIDLY